MGFNITISNFLVLNGVIIALLLAYMLFWRPIKRPSRLKLRQSSAGGQELAKQEGTPDFKNAPEHEVRSERVLNVIFQFNGHDFDAFEVLGIPAGSSIQAAEEAYSVMLKSSSGDSREFLHMAFNAIKRKLTRP